jgi:hypothetical protein
MPGCLNEYRLLHRSIQCIVNIHINMKPFAPIQIHASPFLGRFTLSSMKMKPFSPIQMHASPIFGMVYSLSLSLQYENEAFFPYTNACISHFWDGLPTLSLRRGITSPDRLLVYIKTSHFASCHPTNVYSLYTTPYMNYAAPAY